MEQLTIRPYVTKKKVPTINVEETEALKEELLQFFTENNTKVSFPELTEVKHAPVPSLLIGKRKL